MNVETIQKELTEAREMYRVYVELQSEKAALDASMKKCKAELQSFAERNRGHFDDDGNFKITDKGYLHFGETAKVVEGPNFSFKKMVAKAPEYVKAAYNTSMIKKAMENAEMSARFEDLDISIKTAETFSIVAKK